MAIEIVKEKEHCIMPNFVITYEHNGFPMECHCRNVRYDDRCHRHEIYGASNRNKSIEYGLVVFIDPEYHNLTRYGVHDNKDLRQQLQAYGQQVAMEHYGWNINDFRKIFGRNYL